MEDDEYECAFCHGIFKLVRNETWSDEKAMKEYKEKFPYSNTEDIEIVCDDCWQIIKPD